MLLQAEPVTIQSVPSLLGRVDDAEWATRVELAACYRLAARMNWTDLVYTHISAAVPGPDHHFLINPFGLTFSEVTASNLVKVSLSGDVLTETPYAINRAGFIIHGAIHEARSDVKCVMHNHTVAGMAISMLKGGIEPVSQHAMRFFDRVGYHDYEGIVLDTDERTRLTTNLANKRVMVLRNHGLLTAGRTVGEAFILMWYLEKACQAQLTAMNAAGGLGGLNVIKAEVAEETAQQFGDDTRAAGTVEWPALLRELDRDDPSYKS